MDLFTLYEKVIPHLPPNRAKDIKTAVRALAKALEYNDPHHCPPEAYAKPLPTIYRLVEQHLSSKGPHTIRNTKNNLSALFRAADTQHLLPLTPATATCRFSDKDFKSKRHRTGSGVIYSKYRLHLRDWPPALTTAFADFTTWATAPLIEGRPAAWRKRPSTVGVYQAYFEAFFGYLHTIRHLPSLEFHQLFDWTLIHAFVTWHVNKRYQRPTRFMHHFLQLFICLTHQYRPNPELHAKLKEFKGTLPIPTPTYNKSEVWVPLTTLDEIGKALWPRKAPKDLHSSGTLTARHASLSLMLRLWCRRPYRQRNMREMELGKNLYRDSAGAWTIKFVGDQLKVGEKRGRQNVFTLPFPVDLVPTLEEYLAIWRPLLTATGKNHNVFLNHNRPYTYRTLNQAVRSLTFSYTGKALHPHLIRSIWATEHIMETGNYGRAAVMLNDRLETVIKQYAHLTEHGVAEQTDQWIVKKFAA